MDKKITIKEIDFEFYGEGINIKVVARIGGIFICSFNCESKYMDTAEECVYSLIAEQIRSGKGLIECLNKMGNTQYTEEEIREFI